MSASILSRLERRLRRYAVPHLTVYLVLGQLFFYLAAVGNPGLVGQMDFNPSRLVSEGEWWRVFVFLFIPPTTHPVFLVFVLSFYWMIGTALEQHWGAFRYNLFVLVGYLGAMAAAFLSPEGSASNGYLMSSLFLAFAFLYPDYQVLLFFILPVKVKWLALIVWLFYGMQFLNEDLQGKLLILAAVANYLLFFGRDILRLAKRQLVVREGAAQARAAKDEPFHRCTVCGATDLTDRDRGFRYVPECVCEPCLEARRARGPGTGAA